MVTSRMVISILGLVAPMIAAFTITYFGGLEYVNSFRPLFIIQFLGSLVIFIVRATKLEEPVIERRTMNRNILGNFSEIFQAVPGLKWILLMEIVRTFFMGIRMPLMGLYFYEVKKKRMHTFLDFRVPWALRLHFFSRFPWGILLREWDDDLWDTYHR